MMKQGLTLVLLIGVLVPAIRASTHIPETDFRAAGGWWAAWRSQPMFFFSAGSCYPEPGENNGKQTDGTPGQCSTDPNTIAKGCRYQIPWSGNSNTLGEIVPTYYSVTRCGDDYHVTYNLYFSHDSGHKSDWEWVDIVWKRGSDGLYYQDYVVMEQDGLNVYYPWNSLGTFNGEDDKFDGGRGQNRDHPKIYVGKYHHAFYPDSCGKNKNQCDVLPVYSGFRMNDFYMWSSQNANLASISAIDPNWTYGQATNPHNTAADICSKGLMESFWCS